MDTRHLILPLTAMAVSGSTALAATKPNVVVIVADDLGWGDVSCHGSTIRTPHIDRLAVEGIELNCFYSAPISSPARAGLLTGRYPSRFGFREAVLPPWRDFGLDEGERTVADMLAANGYENRAAIGKWHLGHARKAYHPLRRGFTYFYGCYNGAIDYFTHLREGELDWHENWESSYDKGYSTDLIARKAASCVRKFATEKAPYFVYACFNAPHSPYEAPQEEIDRLIDRETFARLDKKEQNAVIYRAMVERMDRGVGEILDAIEKSGEAKNTLVLFMSDNGGVPGMKGGASNLPLRGFKFQEWDGGVRVVAAMRWPARFQQGVKCEQLTGFVDFMPTLADLIGDRSVQKRPYDGISVADVLTGKRASIERSIYLGCGAVVGNGWKLIRPGFNPKMKLSEEWLVNFEADPYETKNSMTGNEKVADRLRETAIKYDTLTPYHREVPYDEGQIGFVAPHEWKMTKE